MAVKPIFEQPSTEAADPDLVFALLANPSRPAYVAPGQSVYDSALQDILARQRVFEINEAKAGVLTSGSAKEFARNSVIQFFVDWLGGELKDKKSEFYVAVNQHAKWIAEQQIKNSSPAFLAGSGEYEVDAEDTPSGTLTGTLHFTDLNENNFFTAWANGSTNNIGTLQVSVSDGSVKDDGQGSLTFNYVIDPAVLATILEGQTRTDTFNITVRDNYGKESIKTITVETTGAATPPPPPPPGDGGDGSGPTTPPPGELLYRVTFLDQFYLGNQQVGQTISYFFISQADRPTDPAILNGPHIPMPLGGSYADWVWVTFSQQSGADYPDTPYFADPLDALAYFNTDIPPAQAVSSANDIFFV